MRKEQRFLYFLRLCAIKNITLAAVFYYMMYDKDGSAKL